jgi:hypothetical protein
MVDYLNIGSSPCYEPCAQVGEPGYPTKAKEECFRFIEEIRKVCGKEPPGAFLKVKSFPHDFGTYYEVVCFFDEENAESMDYAFHVEGNSPVEWGEEEGSRKWEKRIA